MRTLLISAVVLLGLAVGGVTVYRRTAGTSATPAGTPSSAGGPGGATNSGGRGGFVARPPMTVETAPARRADVAQRILLVGNLIGAATVEVVPKVNGRLDTVDVRLGDAVRRGQRIARVEDSEIREQVKQTQAAFDVASATVRQREADLKFAETNLDRSRNLFERQLLPKQSLDDADARYQSGQAQLDLARAQFAQARSRLTELRINLDDTVITSPVNGFVGKRYLDPGAFVSPNAPVASVVDIHVVRLIANLVEKDLRSISAGKAADVEVDAYPGDTFVGRVARVAPVLDPATRTAQIEVEVPNSDWRLKPGMYARVRFTLDQHSNALVVPRNAIVDLDGRTGVFVAAESVASFKPIETGIQENDLVEVTDGLREGERVITTGAGALRDGDRILLSGQRPRDGNGRSGPRPAGPSGATDHDHASTYAISLIGREVAATRADGIPRPGHTGSSSVGPAARPRWSRA